jgi:hypothetical protein
MSHLLGELVGVLLLALVEPHVLEQHDRTRSDVDAREPIALEGYGHAQQVREPFGDRRERKLLVVLPFLGPAQMRHHQDLRFLVEGQVYRRQRRANARIAGHDAGADRHVQILANEDTLAGQVDIGHFDDLHGSAPHQCHLAFDHASVVSSMRLEKPHSLSYQAQALTSLIAIRVNPRFLL